MKLLRKRELKSNIPLKEEMANINFVKKVSTYMTNNIDDSTTTIWSFYWGY
jgi:hypothetical protein